MPSRPGRMRRVLTLREKMQRDMLKRGPFRPHSGTEPPPDQSDPQPQPKVEKSPLRKQDILQQGYEKIT